FAGARAPFDENGQVALDYRVVRPHRRQDRGAKGRGSCTKTCKQKQMAHPVLSPTSLLPRASPGRGYYAFIPPKSAPSGVDPIIVRGAEARVVGGEEQRHGGDIRRLDPTVEALP